MMEYGTDLLAHFLLSELVAEGLLEKEGEEFYYRGPRNDYRVGVTFIPVRKTVQLSED